MSLYSRMDRLAADNERIEGKVDSLANAPQSQRTSVEGGSIDFNDADGNLKAIVGEQDDGGNTINVLSGPTPPTPSGFTVDVDHGKFILHWFGDFTTGGLAPSDWSRAEVHASRDPFFVPDRTTARGSIVSAAGGEVTIGVLKGSWTIKMVSWSQAGKMSLPSQPVAVDVPGYGEIVLEEIDAAQTRIDNARLILVEGQETLGTKLDESEAALTALRASLDDLDSTTLPALRQDLDAAEGRLTSAEGQITDAFGELATIPGQISAAQQAAIDAAALDAEAKASAAQTAAETAAQALVDAVETGASPADIAALQQYADDAADAAKLAADIAAQAKADQALADAKADATAKAGAAQTAAEAKAATAQQKADLANDTAQALLSAGPNIIVNGDFENTSQNIWPLTTYQSGISVITAPHARSGARVMRADSTASNRYPLTDWRDSAAGRIYYAEIWVYHDDTDMSQRGRVSFYSQSELKDGSTPGDYGKDMDGNRVYVYQDDLPPLQWNKVAAYITTPADTLRVRVAPHVLRNETPYDLDDFKVIDVTESIGALREARAAQDAADMAHDMAGNAQDAAEAAMSTANGLSKVLHGTTLPTGTAPDGSIWWQHRGNLSGPVLGQWNRVSGSWKSTPIDSEAIANLDVGKLTAGAGEIATIVSQKIASAVGQFLELDVGNLTVTGASKLAAVVAEQIAADVGQFIELEVGNLVAGVGVMDEATIQKLFTDVVVASMAMADEFIGENAILTGAVTAPKITASEELWAKLAQFVTVYAEMVDSDVFNGRVFRGSTFLTTNESSWSDRGMFLLDDEGNPRIQAPTDGSDFTINAEVVAKSLTATGRASFLSENNRLEPGAGLILAAGVGDPPSPPVVSTYYPTIKAPLQDTDRGAYGLAWADGHFWRWVENEASDWSTAGSNRGRLEKISTSGDVVASFDTGDFLARNGAVGIGAELFLLGPKTGTNDRRWVQVYGTDGALKRQWEYTEYGSGTYQPGVGRDEEGKLLIAQCGGTGYYRHRVYSTTGALLSVFDGNDRTNSDINGIYVGAADFGTRRILASKRSGTGRFRQFPVFNTTNGDYVGSQSWYSPEQEEARGVAWDGSKFHSIDTAGVISEYSTLSTGGDGLTSDWWAVYRWAKDVDADLTIDLSSRISPPARFSWPRRARLRITAPNLPQQAGEIAPSLAYKTTRPTRTDFHSPTWWSSTGEPTAYYYELPTNWQSAPTPGEGNNFPDGEPSVLSATSGLFEVKGDGSGRWGPLTFNADGTMSSTAVPVWVPVTTFTSGYGPNTFGFAPAYRLWPDGKVEWRGNVAGTLSANADILTVPAAVRPAQAVNVPVASNNPGSRLRRAEFLSSAAPTMLRVYSGEGDGTWVSLDGISYYKS